MNEINEKIINTKISAVTIVDPTGVEKRIDAKIPAAAQMTDMTAEHRITALKLLKTRIADSAGKIMSAEIRREPTRFMASTMIRAVTTAIIRL